MIALIPPSMPCRVPRSPSVISRPPANRRIVRGSASRNAAIVRSASARRHHRQVAERRAGPRVEEVQRHLVGLELGELRGELGALLQRLPHADDAAAAHLHARPRAPSQRLPALLPGMRGDHGREVRAGRLQVVVVAVHAHLGELVDLRLGEHAERAGDVDVDRGADRGDARRAPAPSAARPGRAPRPRCRTRSRRWPRSPPPPRTSAGDVEPRRAHRRARTARTASRSGSPPGSRRS